MRGLAELFNRPARFKPVQIDKASGPVHHLLLLFLFAEGEDVYYGQYTHGIKYKETYKPGQVSIPARFPQGNPLPRHIPRYQYQ
jgi:hypothetical protein